MWECGLKHPTRLRLVASVVTPYVGVWIETSDVEREEVTA